MTRKENSDYRASVGRRQSQQCLCPRKHTEHALAEVRSVLLEQKSTQTNLLGSGKTLIHFCFFFRHSCVLREPVLNHCKRLCCKLEYAVSRNNSTVCLRDSLNSQSILFFLKNIYVFTWKAERQRGGWKRERESFKCWFTFQMAIRPGARPGQSQDPGTPRYTSCFWGTLTGS